jgi:hypothetical protein
MAVYPYPNNNSPLMWVVPKAGFTIQDIAEALFLPDGSYDVEQLFTTPALRYEFVDHETSMLWQDKDAPAYLLGNFGGYGCMYYDNITPAIGYQNLHLTHLWNGHNVLYDGVAPISQNAVFAQHINFYREQRYTRYVFYLEPESFVNILYNLRPQADTFNPIIQQCKLSIFDYQGNNLFLAEQNTQLAHHGSDIHFYNFIQRNNANTGWETGIIVPALGNTGSELANRESFWIYNPTQFTKTYYIDVVDFDFTPRPSVFFRIIKTPIAFQTNVLYRNFRSFAYRFALPANRASSLSLSGIYSINTALSYVITAFNASHQQIGGVLISGALASGVTINREFTTPANCAYIIVSIMSPQQYSQGFSGCNYSFRII